VTIKGLVSEEKFSGHESFVCRYGWLRKAYDGVVKSPKLFADEGEAVVKLGVGSNMVRSLEFWSRAFGVIDGHKAEYKPTKFGKTLLDPKHGKDPYLEDLGSLWLLHWKLATSDSNLAAWNLVFQDLQEWRVTRARLMEMLRRRGRRTKGALAESTVKQHLDILVNTYTTARANDVRALEESLGSPLQELGLLTRVQLDSSEEVIEIHTGSKPTLPAQVFLNAVVDHWERNYPTSASMSLQEISFAKRSPGVVFRLDEASVIGYLSEFNTLTHGLMQFQEGALIRGLQLSRKTKINEVRAKCALL
jgi:hypothetical protein